MFLSSSRRPTRCLFCESGAVAFPACDSWSDDVFSQNEFLHSPFRFPTCSGVCSKQMSVTSFRKRRARKSYPRGSTDARKGQDVVMMTRLERLLKSEPISWMPSPIHTATCEWLLKSSKTCLLSLENLFAFIFSARKDSLRIIVNCASLAINTSLALESRDIFFRVGLQLK